MVLSGLLLGLAVGCRDKGGETFEDPLVLELGGDSPTVDEVLNKTSRRSVEPEPAAAPEGDVAPEGVALPAGDATPEGAAEPEPRPLPIARPERVVKLPAGWTLSELCKEALGEASRWREVAELNGWSEEQLTSLAPGTEVRLPNE